MNRKEILMKRLNIKLMNFHESLRSMSRTQLISMSGRIAAVTEAHEYMTKHYDWYDDAEVQYMLLFDDPLTLVADLWESNRADISDLEMSIWEVFDKSELLSDYPLTDNTYDYLSGTR